MWSSEVLSMHRLSDLQEMGVGYVHGTHLVSVEFLW